jgi:hypothetical protein
VTAKLKNTLDGDFDNLCEDQKFAFSLSRLLSNDLGGKNKNKQLGMYYIEANIS